MKKTISILLITAGLFLALTSPFWMTSLLIKDSELFYLIPAAILFILILCIVSLATYFPLIIKNYSNNSNSQKDKDPKIGIKIGFSFGASESSKDSSENKKEKDGDREFLRALKVIYDRIFETLDDSFKK